MCANVLLKRRHWLLGQQQPVAGLICFIKKRGISLLCSLMKRKLIRMYIPSKNVNL